MDGWQWNSGNTHMANQLRQQIEQISREKNINPEVIIHAIEDAMIHRQRQINTESRLDGVIHDKGSFVDAASGQNVALWGIEDGMKLIDSMSSQIG